MASLDLEGPLRIERHHRADRDLDRLRGARPDRQVVDVAQVVGNRVVHLVAAHAHRAVHRDPAQRDDRHLARTSTDIHDHPPDRLLDRQPGADRGRDRLLD